MTSSISTATQTLPSKLDYVSSEIQDNLNEYGAPKAYASAPSDQYMSTGSEDWQLRSLDYASSSVIQNILDEYGAPEDYAPSVPTSNPNPSGGYSLKGGSDRGRDRG